jgi:hypothetical protein
VRLDLGTSAYAAFGSVASLLTDTPCLAAVFETVDDSLAGEPARADGQDDRRLVAGRHDHVIGLWRAMDEVPRLQLAFLVLEDQEAGAGEDEEILFRFLAVIEAQALPRLEDADVDPQLAEGPLALEVAVVAERPRVPPAGLAGVYDEPAVDVCDEAVLRFPEGRLGHPCSLGRRPSVDFAA